MSPKNRFSSILACLLLQFGSLVGVPIRPEHVEEMMQAMNKTKVAHSNPEEERKDTK